MPSIDLTGVTLVSEDAFKHIFPKFIFSNVFLQKCTLKYASSKHCKCILKAFLILERLPRKISVPKKKRQSQEHTLFAGNSFWAFLPKDALLLRFARILMMKKSKPQSSRSPLGGFSSLANPTIPPRHSVDH